MRSGAANSELCDKAGVEGRRIRDARARRLRRTRSRWHQVSLIQVRALSNRFCARRPSRRNSGRSRSTHPCRPSHDPGDNTPARESFLCHSLPHDAQLCTRTRCHPPWPARARAQASMRDKPYAAGLTGPAPRFPGAMIAPHRHHDERRPKPRPQATHGGRALVWTARQ